MDKELYRYVIDGYAHANGYECIEDLVLSKSEDIDSMLKDKHAVLTKEVSGVMADFVRAGVYTNSKDDYLKSVVVCGGLADKYFSEHGADDSEPIMSSAYCGFYDNSANTLYTSELVFNAWLDEQEYDESILKAVKDYVKLNIAFIDTPWSEKYIHGAIDEVIGVGDANRFIEKCIVYGYFDMDVDRLIKVEFK